MINEYRRGTKNRKPFKSASDMFAAMDLEDAAEDEDEQIHP